MLLALWRSAVLLRREGIRGMAPVPVRGATGGERPGAQLTRSLVGLLWRGVAGGARVRHLRWLALFMPPIRYARPPGRRPASPGAACLGRDGRPVRPAPGESTQRTPTRSARPGRRPRAQRAEAIEGEIVDRDSGDRCGNSASDPACVGRGRGGPDAPLVTVMRIEPATLSRTIAGHLRRRQMRGGHRS